MNTFLWIITAIGLGVGLAMDACAVSMSNGLANPKMKISIICLIAVFFGVFQILMPIIGYLSVTLLSNALGESFTTIFSYLVPWIALTLLLIFGIKMIVEGIKEGKHKEEKVEEKVLTIGTLLVQAIATSIDALSVGVIYGNVNHFKAYITFLIVGIVTFFISFASVFIGKKFGTIFENKATIAGGIILCAIGLEIFFTHWSDVVNGLNTLFNLF